MKKVLLAMAATSLLFLNVTGHAATNLQLQHNKETVTAFYNEIVNKKDFDAAAKYIGSHYTQHDPQVKDGPDGLKELIQFLRDKYPQASGQIVRIFAEDDYVVLHVHSTLEPGTRGNAVMDLFKLEDGKVVEHWDIAQEVPETSANPNGMF